MSLQDFKVLTFDVVGTQKGSGGTLESEHTVPNYHFHMLAALADAVEAGR